MNVIVKFHDIDPNWPDLVMEQYDPDNIPAGFREMSIEEYNALFALVKDDMKAHFDEIDRQINEERLAREAAAQAEADAKAAAEQAEFEAFKAWKAAQE